MMDRFLWLMLVIAGGLIAVITGAMLVSRRKYFRKLKDERFKRYKDSRP